VSGPPVATARTCATGWFGKVPALGDFVVRRLPASFRERWDTWLSEGMLAGERALGDGWTDAFLSFPVWRFVWLDPARRTAWAGVLAPGADRVGRLFPVTVARELAPHERQWPSFEHLDDWMDTLESYLLTLFEDDDVDAFDRALLGAAPPPDDDRTIALPEPARTGSATAVGSPASPAPPDAFDRPFDFDAAGTTPLGLAQAIAWQVLSRGAQPVAWFWCRDPDGATRTRLVGGGFSAAAFVALVRPQP
jgi:type VI secretion system protein ImpM